MFDIYIQNQFLKTPGGNPLEVPTLALAKAIEEEWEKDPAPHYRQKPLTSLVATTLDRVVEARETYISYIIQAISTDMILFWVQAPESLVRLQEEKWGPLIEKTNKALDLNLKPTSTLSIPPLSSEEEKKTRETFYHLTAFKFTGFIHLLTLTSSFCISYLVLQGRLSPEDAWDLAHLPERDQRRIWGEDKEALVLEKALREEFLETSRFLELVM